MRKWTDNTIEREIMKIANQFDPPKMPSLKESKEMYGGCGLSCAISKSGGFKYWAEKLGLPQEKSETKVGIEGEIYIAQLLKKMGYSSVEMTSVRHPYDLLVDDCVKIDVKTSNTSYIKGCPVHAYRLAKRQHTCDLYIFYEADTGDIYVVPAHLCKGQTQVEMGGGSKKYLMYRKAFHLIGALRNTYQQM